MDNSEQHHTGEDVIPPELIEKFSKKGQPAAARLAARMMADSRHKHRVTSIIVTAKGYVRKHSSTRREDAYAAAAALIAVECLGEGGPFGAGGMRRSTVRHPPFDQLGNGRALAHDGRAWSLAMFAALPQVAERVLFAYVNGEFIATVTRPQEGERVIHLDFIKPAHLRMLACRGFGLALDVLPLEGPDEIEFENDPTMWAAAVEATEEYVNEGTHEAGAA